MIKRNFKLTVLSLFLLGLININLMLPGSPNFIVNSIPNLGSSPEIQDNLNPDLISDNEKISSVSSSYILENSDKRDGKNLKSAINLFENTTQIDFITNTTSSNYYRYYSRFPYQYVNIDLISNESGTSIFLLDQFNTTITYSSSLSFTKTLQVSSTESLANKEKIRFIGWYYIKISSTNVNTQFNLTFSFIKGDGSSLWSPILIEQGEPAWSNIFIPKENSEKRFSLFFSFYVEKTNPEIKISINADSFSFTMLYDPDFNFLTLSYNRLEWYTQKEGLYYIEVNGQNFEGKQTSINLKLFSNGTISDNSFQNPLEVDRNSGIIDEKFQFTNRFLKIYLFHGENVSLTLGNNSNNFNYNVYIYGPWGSLWKYANSTNTPEFIRLNNIPESGYYILEVDGPPGGYNLEINFHYKIEQGSTWQSAELIEVDDYYKDDSFVTSQQEYYYRLKLNQTEIYKISLLGSKFSNLSILGKNRQIVATSSISDVEASVYINPNSNGDLLYINISMANIFDEYSLIVQKLTEIEENYINIRGQLNYLDPVTNEVVELPLLKILLMEKDLVADDILLESSTSINGDFSFFVNNNTDPDENDQDLYLKIIFDSPALQVRKYNQDKEIYSYIIDLEDNNNRNINLNQIFVPDNIRKIANMFNEINQAWLWLENSSSTLYGPEQVILFYSTNSPGTYYLPYGTISASNYYKYFIAVLGVSTDDDALDDSVLIHEYGHHVEQIYDISFSPAGSHSFGTVASPDLGHGEGFPTFFANIIKQTPIYKDTYISGGTEFYFGFNAETSEYLTSTSSNKLYDLLGSFGESSVISLYWDLVDPDNGDDINFDGIAENTTIDIQDIFDIFVNFREFNTSGVTSIDRLYKGLIFKKIYDIDEISRTYYEHGAGDVSYPFIIPETNKIIESSDLNANFTWKLFDNNPKSYEIFMNNSKLFEGIWNFTEETIYLNLNQFNLSFGRTYFTLRLTDTFDNQRSYTYWVRNYIDFQDMGINFSNAIDLSFNNYFSSEINQTAYFVFETELSGVYGFTINKSQTLSLSLTIYNDLKAVTSFLNSINNSETLFIRLFSNVPVYFKIKYLTGDGTFNFASNGMEIGSNVNFPILIANSVSFNYSDYNFPVTLYLKYQTSLVNRNLTLNVKGFSNFSINFYFSNGTLFESFSQSENGNTILVFIPLQLLIDNQISFNPFDEILIEIIPYSIGETFSVETNPNQNADLSFSGSVKFYYNQKNELLFNYAGLGDISIQLYSNKSLIQPDILFRDQNSIVIDISFLTPGKYFFVLLIEYEFGSILIKKLIIDILPAEPLLNSSSTYSSSQTRDPQDITGLIGLVFIGAFSFSVISWIRFRKKLN